MNKKLRWITETAVLLALLICLQWVGSLISTLIAPWIPTPILNQIIKQLITGTFVNCVLAVAALYAGLGSGIAIAVISPVCAYFLGIAPNSLTVLPIMAGNVCYVVLLGLIIGKTVKPFWKQPVGLAAAASVKFGVMYLLVVQLICKLLVPSAPAMLSVMFSWPQLVTAVSGGIIALAITPVLRKALHK